MDKVKPIENDGLENALGGLADELGILPYDNLMKLVDEFSEGNEDEEFKC